MTTVEIIELIETCFASPSQWEGTLSNGQMFYVRYRHGKLTIGIGATVDEAFKDSDNFERQVAFGRQCVWSDVEPYFAERLAAWDSPA